jgi:hypothetical protein
VSASSFGSRKSVSFSPWSALQLLGVVVLALVVCLPASSQTSQGRIFGGVMDQSGGVVAGAKVTVTDVERGINLVLTTDSAGEYNATNLIPGAYQIRAEATGFETVNRQNIDVLVGQELRIDFTLMPGATNQTITITESVPLVNTTSATMSSTIENLDISELPINGRNFQSVTDLRPGIQTTPGGGTDARSANGQRTESNIWLLDGLFNKGTYGGNSVIGGGNLAGEGATLVPLDTIQEISFIEDPKAEYGWGSGAIVNLGFKSGTNALHGTAYAYGRFPQLETRNPFALVNPGTDLEQFGNSLGGPIKKDKIFFFGGYEGKRVSSSTTASGTEPTTASLGGNPTNSFPDAIAALEVPTTATPAGPGYCNPAAAGCTKPLSQLSLDLAGCTLPAGLTGAATCSPANSSSTAGCTLGSATCTGLFNNSSQSTSIPVQVPNFQHTDNFLIKIDDHLSDTNSLHGEYFFGTGQTYSNVGTPVQTYWGSTTPVRGQGVTVVDVWTPNSVLVNEARGGWHDYDQVIGIGECANEGASTSTSPDNAKSNLVAGSPNYPSGFGLNTGSQQPCAFPFLTISSFTGLGGEARGFEPRRENRAKFEDAVSYTRGKHSFKFGIEYHDSYLTGGAHGDSQGVINFGGTGGNIPGFAGTPTAVEDYLVGYTNTDSLLIGSPETTTIQHFWAGFAQDDWRLTRKVTVNLGVRYEYRSPISEAHNQFGDFVGSLTNPTAVPISGLAQTGVTPGFSQPWKPDYADVAPRVGMAWDLTGTGKTVARAGAGWMYDYEALSGILGQGISPNATPTAVPFYGTNGLTVADPQGATTTTAVIAYPAGVNPFQATQQIFPTNSVLSCGEGGAPGATPPVGFTTTTAPQECGVGGFDPNAMKEPLMYYYNADIQRSFGSNYFLDVAYVGDHTIRNIQQQNINQPTPGYANGSTIAPGFTATNNAYIEQVRQPYYSQYPWIGQIRWDSNVDSQRYNALQVTFTKRASHGLDFTGTYVLSQQCDVAIGEFTASTVQNNYNRKADYACGDSAHGGRVTLTMTWEIPGPKGHWQMLQGWRFNNIVYILGRLPFNPADTTDDTSGTGVKADRWTLVGNPHAFDWSNLPQGGGGGYPCYGFLGSTFAKTATSNCAAALPQACITAATNEPTNANLSSTPTLTGLPTGVNTVSASGFAPNSGLYNLYKYGCYMMDNAVMVPPAQGTYGNMTKNMIFGIPQREWDSSLTKTWKITERFSTQFRVEVYNLPNTTHYAAPGANLGAPSTFGQSKATLNTGGISISAGAQREAQLALKIIF